MPETYELTQEQIDGIVAKGAAAGEKKAKAAFSEELKKMKEDLKIEIAKEIHPFEGGKYIANPEKGQSDKEPLLGKIGLSIIRSKGIPELAIKYAKDRLESEKTLANERLVKALNISNFAEGGLLIPDDVLPDIQDHLRANAVIRRMTRWVLPMIKGGLKLVRGTGDPTAEWVDENIPAAATDPTFDVMTMHAHNLKAKTVLSNDLLEADDYGVEEYVSNALAESIGLAEDLAAIRGDGGENSPIGIKNQLASGNDFASAGTSLENVMTDLGTAAAKFGTNNVNANPDAVGILMNPGTKSKLRIMADTTGVVFPFKDEISESKLFDWKLDTTTQIPINLGAGSNESEIYVVDFSKFIIGETKQLMLKFSDSGAYENPPGTTYSLDDRDQSIIRATEKVDFGLVKDVAACRISGVQYFLS